MPTRKPKPRNASAGRVPPVTGRSLLDGAAVPYSAMADWSTAPLADELPRLLGERSMTLRALADAVGVDVSHLSRAIRGDRGKRPSADLFIAVAKTLDVPPEHFPEYRELLAVIEVKANPTLRDTIIEQTTSPRQPGENDASTQPGRVEQEALRSYAGKWVALAGPLQVLAVADTPQELAASLEGHRVPSYSTLRVPERDELSGDTARADD